MKHKLVAIVLALVFIFLIASLSLFSNPVSVQGGYAYGASLNATDNLIREYIPWQNTNEVRRFVNESEFWKRDEICWQVALDFVQYAKENGREVGLYAYDAPGTVNDHMANFVIIKDKVYIVEPQWKWGGLKEIGKLK